MMVSHLVLILTTALLGILASACQPSGTPIELTQTHIVAQQTLTPNPTSSLSAEQKIAFTLVTKNADWTPVEADFDEVAMVLVPVGCFMMGSPKGEGEIEEKPEHLQCLDTPFWIDKYEVTNSQFNLFDGVSATHGFWEDDNRPRENITWFEARDFCLKRSARLPNEREWEYAARGPDGLEFPWGNAWNRGKTVWGPYGPGALTETADVGSHRAGVSWVGAMDMSGNVWEWTSSLYADYPYTADDEVTIPDDELKAGLGDRAIISLRGGGWFSFITEPRDVRALARDWSFPGSKNMDLGVRCARDV
jgi:sulfatase modifying factor 1